jgi:AraC family transcriptional regulator, transcriptional activator FtrA
MPLRRVSVVLVEPVSIFEFGLAVEVFGVDRTDDGVPPIDFRVCAPEPGRLMVTHNTASFSIVPPYGLDAVAGSDLVLVNATQLRSDDEYPADVLDVLRRAHSSGSTLLSLCTGSFILGAAGLLDGRRCTTHWKYAEEMQQRYPTARVEPNALFVEDGTIITSAGTAAGIDASLHLVRRELGTAIATKVARRMVVPPQRDGGQQQFVDLPIPVCATDSLTPVLTWVVEHLDQQHTASSLARRAMMSDRTFARRFVAETGTTPHQWVTQQRILAARSLLEESDLSVEQIAARVGFNSAVVLREQFRRTVGLAPHAYRQRFGAITPDQPLSA